MRSCWLVDTTKKEREKRIEEEHTSVRAVQLCDRSLVEEDEKQEKVKRQQ